MRHHQAILVLLPGCRPAEASTLSCSEEDWIQDTVILQSPSVLAVCR